MTNLGKLGLALTAPRGSGLGAIIVSDTYTRTAGAIGSADTGQAYTQHIGTAATNGTTVTLATSEAHATLDAGVANYDASVDLLHASNPQMLVVRGTGIQNVILAGFLSGGSNDFTVYEWVGGVYTQRYLTALGTHQGTVRVVAQAGSLAIYFAAALLTTVASAVNQASGTRVGLYGTGTFDNLLVRSA